MRKLKLIPAEFLNTNQLDRRKTKLLGFVPQKLKFKTECGKITEIDLYQTPGPAEVADKMIGGLGESFAVLVVEE
jgi:hypothetical protein